MYKKTFFKEFNTCTVRLYENMFTMKNDNHFTTFLLVQSLYARVNNALFETADLSETVQQWEPEGKWYDLSPVRSAAVPLCGCGYSWLHGN